MKQLWSRLVNLDAKGNCGGKPIGKGATVPHSSLGLLVFVDESVNWVLLGFCFHLFLVEPRDVPFA